MRQVTLDTETTGLEPENGHRIIEIGCIEVIDRRLTGNNLHHYIHPERDIDEGATRVHGITIEQLEDKPRFAEVAGQIVDFCRGAEVIIHNAPFDLAFLDAELARLGQGPFEPLCGRVTDSLRVAREMFPGKRNSLDALCDRMMVPNAHRTVHGALLDAQLLAEVYLAMTRGQGSLAMAQSFETQGSGSDEAGVWPPSGLVVRQASAQELADHLAMLDELERQGGGPLRWRQAG